MKTASRLTALVLILVASGCAGLRSGDQAIMQTAPGDPIGSANIGTGSVTVNAGIPPEAKSAGIGLAP
jgi:hypothetical protein